MSFMKTTIILFLAVLLTAACSGQQSKENRATGEGQQSEPVYEFEPWEGEGLEIPLDGSSREAWETSMARVKAHTSESNYVTLRNAIQYLLVYDLPSQRDFDKLIKRLDGQTGYEVLARVKWRQPAPGKGPAEKGAADAKIIDS